MENYTTSFSFSFEKLKHSSGSCVAQLGNLNNLSAPWNSCGENLNLRPTLALFPGGPVSRPASVFVTMTLHCQCPMQHMWNWHSASTSHSLKVMHEGFKPDLFDFKALYVIPRSTIKLDWQCWEEPFIHSQVFTENLRCASYRCSDAGDTDVNKHNFSVLTQSLQSK